MRLSNDVIFILVLWRRITIQLEGFQREFETVGIVLFISLRIVSAINGIWVIWLSFQLIQKTRCTKGFHSLVLPWVPWMKYNSGGLTFAINLIWTFWSGSIYWKGSLNSIHLAGQIKMSNILNIFSMLKQLRSLKWLSS